MDKPEPNSCPVCRHVTDIVTLDVRPEVPSLQNIVLPTRAAAEAFPKGAVRMLRCSNCSFVWNADFDQNCISYDGNYNNDATSSPYYLAHLDDVADRVIASVGSEMPLHYVEIGCGEGDFLRLVCTRAKGRVTSATGFDPSFTGDDKLPECAVVHRTFFTPELVSKIPEDTNVICSRHTIEHVADVQVFAAALAAAMAPGRTLFLETPNADWILENAAFQDFFYEHCSIYTPRSIETLLSQQGLECEVSAVYDGQYMWITAKLAELDTLDAAPQVGDVLAKKYLKDQGKLLHDWRAYLTDRKQHGPVALWGGSSKGVTFALLFNTSGDQLVDCVIDLNEAKQEQFMPTSGTKIVSPQTAHNSGVSTIVIMNPNYEDEIREQILTMGWDVEVVVLNGA